ncbi:hypothetical protein D3C72_2412220 [compost metagenome]
MRLAVLVRQRGAEGNVLAGQVVVLAGQVSGDAEGDLNGVVREAADFRDGQLVEGRTTAAGRLGFGGHLATCFLRAL